MRILSVQPTNYANNAFKNRKTQSSSTNFTGILSGSEFEAAARKVTQYLERFNEITVKGEEMLSQDGISWTKGKLGDAITYLTGTPDANMVKVLVNLDDEVTFAFAQGIPQAGAIRNLNGTGPDNLIVFMNGNIDRIVTPEKPLKSVVPQPFELLGTSPTTLTNNPFNMPKGTRYAVFSAKCAKETY